MGDTLLFTIFSHKVIALDERNGRELWHARVKNIAMSTPIVAGNTVCIGTGKSGALNRSFFQTFQFCIDFRNAPYKMKDRRQGRSFVMAAAAGFEDACVAVRNRTAAF